MLNKPPLLEFDGKENRLFEKSVFDGFGKFDGGFGFRNEDDYDDCIKGFMLLKGFED